MCGLVGVLFRPQRRSPRDFAKILSITTAGLLGNEERGRDATGIAVVQGDGGCQVFKEPVQASAFVEMPGYVETLAAVGPDTVCILGHTRLPTKGSPKRRANNHPIVTQDIVGVHNGVIHNDDALFAAHGLPRAGQVDSEILFRMQGQIDPRIYGPRYATAVGTSLNGLRGICAALSVDLRQPTRLLALKYRRPLCLHYEPSLGALFFSSRYVLLRREFGSAVVWETLEEGYGYLFDAMLLRELQSTPAERFRFVLDAQTSDADVRQDAVLTPRAPSAIALDQEFAQNG